MIGLGYFGLTPVVEFGKHCLVIGCDSKSDRIADPNRGLPILSMESPMT
jgi:UDP-N-acetyl-D-mannosaminuronate dehydrogenase